MVLPQTLSQERERKGDRGENAFFTCRLFVGLWLVAVLHMPLLSFSSSIPYNNHTIPSHIHTLAEYCSGWRSLRQSRLSGKHSVCRSAPRAYPRRIFWKRKMRTPFSVHFVTRYSQDGEKSRMPQFRDNAYERYAHTTGASGIHSFSSQK